MKGLSVSSTLAIVSLLSIGAAHAADGAVCYSTPVFSMTSTGGTGTTNYPQLANTTKFSCTASIPASTIKELSQAGWIIVSQSPVVYSTTVYSNGSVNTKTRVMLVIQK